MNDYDDIEIDLDIGVKIYTDLCDNCHKELQNIVRQFCKPNKKKS